MLFGFLILLICWLAGHVLVSLTGIPLPGNVAGMLILLAVSLMRRGVGQSTTESSSLLLSHMGLLFVPAGVGLIEHGQLLATQGLAMFAVLGLSVVITLAVTGLTLQWLLRRKQRGQ